ncbi:MAG TPA: hypothetical protein VK811_04190, partial [Candidatus Acidoferrum sp.]|nr:hypothetical protein [Candidatus Acidoferrum sp.]
QQWLDYNGGANGTDDTNLSLLNSCMLEPYVQNPAVYKSPLDLSDQYGTTGQPRNRSYSMNAAIGCITNTAGQGGDSWMNTTTPPKYEIFSRESQLVNSPGPSDLYTFLEEEPDSINDGSFAMQIPASTVATKWIDIPTKAGNVCPFAFADGHAEIHKWLYPGSIPSVTYTTATKSTIPALGPGGQGDPDVLWLAKHTTVLANGASLPY